MLFAFLLIVCVGKFKTSLNSGSVLEVTCVFLLLCVTLSVLDTVCFDSVGWHEVPDRSLWVGMVPHRSLWVGMVPDVSLCVYMSFQNDPVG